MNKRYITLYFRKGEEDLLKGLRRLAKQIGISLNDTIKLLITTGLQVLKENDEIISQLKRIAIYKQLEQLAKYEEIIYRTRKSLLRSHKDAYLWEDNNEIRNRKERTELLPEPLRKAVLTLDNERHKIFQSFLIVSD